MRVASVFVGGGEIFVKNIFVIFYCEIVQGVWDLVLRGNFEISDNDSDDNNNISKNNAKNELTYIGAKIFDRGFTTRRLGAFEVKSGFGVFGMTG